MLLKLIRNKTLAHTQLFRYSNHQNLSDEQAFERNFSMQLRICKNSLQLKELFENNRKKLTVKNYSDLCKKLPKTIQNVKLFTKIQDKGFILNIIDTVNLWKESQLQIQHFQSLLYLHKVLFEKNYNSVVLSKKLTKLGNSQHIIRQIQNLQFKKIALLYRDLYKSSTYNPHLVASLLKRLQQLRASLQQSKQQQEQYITSISQSLIFILDGLANGICQTLLAQKLLIQIIKIIGIIWEKISVIELTKMIYLLNDPFLKEKASIKRKLFVEIEKKILENVDEFDIKTVIFILEDQFMITTKFISKLINKILIQVLESINEQGDSQIDTELMFRCFRSMGKKGAKLESINFVIFYKYLVKTLDNPNNFQNVDQTLQYLISHNFFEKQNQQTIYQLIKNDTKNKWSSKIIRALFLNNFDVVDMFKRNYKYSDKLSIQFIYNAVISKQLLAKHPNDTQLLSIQTQIQTILQSMSSRQFQYHFKKMQYQILDIFHKYYRNYIISHLQEQFNSQRKINQYYAYNYICKHQTPQHQQKYFQKLSPQQRIFFLGRWALNILDNAFYDNFHIKAFCSRVLQDIHIDLPTHQGQFNILKVFNSIFLKILFRPENHEMIQLYVKVIEKFMQKKPESGWGTKGAVTFCFGSNHLYSFLKSGYFYKLLLSTLQKKFIIIRQAEIQNTYILQNVPKKEQLRKLLQKKYKGKKENLLDQVQKPLKENKKIVYYLQLKKSLSPEQYNFVQQSLPKLHHSQLNSFLIRFNLEKSTQSQQLLENIINRFCSRPSIILVDSNIMALTENIKRRVQQGYSPKLLQVLIQNLVQKLDQQLTKQLLLQDQLYLLQQATKLKLNIKINDDVINNLENLLMNNCRYSIEILKRGHQLFKNNKWKISQSMKDKLNQFNL